MRRFVIILLAAVGISTFSGAAEAGFWENLFGGPAVHSSYSVTRVQAAKRFDGVTTRKRSKSIAIARAHKHHFKVAKVKKLSPTSQQAEIARPKAYADPVEAVTAAKTDETLRPGDIIVGHDGPLVYRGDNEANQFVPANDRHVDASLRKKLSAYVSTGKVISLNATVAKPTVRTKQKPFVADSKEPAPRTALEAMARYVDDSQGRRIRFVGGSWSGRKVSVVKISNELARR